ncbi:hypothetical protein [Klebsiella pneumoniae]|uniref:DUF488 family protein, N3 subclade n=1 Tax=Klebsiella pneumoniae TaxID=573 RepID=UPI000D19DA7F|nr:hypothetical protein [Klebsiella pneumoniae]
MFHDFKQLEVWTGRIPDWRKWEELDILFVDTTLKSGEKIFAPTPELLWPYKQGIVNQAEYVEIYYKLTRERFKRDPEPWIWLINQGRICLACYCGHDCFCHRHLLKDILAKLCKKERIRFIDRGEPVW